MITLTTDYKRIIPGFIHNLYFIPASIIRKPLLLIATLLLLFHSLSAQQTSKNDTIVGLVLGRTGKAIRNIPVSYNGCSEIFYTNKKGIFIIIKDVLPDSLNLILPSKRVIQVPVMGMRFLKIITNEASYSVVESKNEIINIGYGMERRSTSISGGFSVTGDQIRETGERNIILAIAGKIPGVNLVYKNDGSTGLMIRGGTSLEGNNDPLYVVDGSIVDDLSNINVNDVAKVEVLKDGTIYGTRGANGVILVFTKK